MRCGKTVLVVDASVLVVALADDGTDEDLLRARLRDERLFAPELVDLEVLSVVRRQTARGALNDRRARMAVRDLRDIPLRRAPHTPLLPRCWELRDNLTPYDAAYVALAEVMQVPLLTADRRLATAAGVQCQVELLEP